MHFAERWRTFRQDQLNISSKQAAYSLGLKPSTYSNYELRVRPFPIDIVLKIKSTFNIPDEQFFELIVGRERKRGRISEDEIQYELQLLKSNFEAKAGKDLSKLLFDTPELLTFLTMLDFHDFSPQDLRKVILKCQKNIIDTKKSN